MPDLIIVIYQRLVMLRDFDYGALVKFADGNNRPYVKLIQSQHKVVSGLIAFAAEIARPVGLAP